MTNRISFTSFRYLFTWNHSNVELLVDILADSPKDRDFPIRQILVGVLLFGECHFDSTLSQPVALYFYSLLSRGESLNEQGSLPKMAKSMVGLCLDLCYCQ